MWNMWLLVLTYVDNCIWRLQWT